MQIKTLLSFTFLLMFNVANSQIAIDNNRNIFLVTSKCTTSCGLEMAYSSKVSFVNDTIQICGLVDGTEKVFSEYFILSKKEKWKISNFHGKSRLEVKDSTNRNYKVKLTLRKGEGTMN